MNTYFRARALDNAGNQAEYSSENGDSSPLVRSGRCAADALVERRLRTQAQYPHL